MILLFCSTRFIIIFCCFIATQRITDHGLDTRIYRSLQIIDIWYQTSRSLANASHSIASPISRVIDVMGNLSSTCAINAEFSEGDSLTVDLLWYKIENQLGFTCVGVLTKAETNQDRHDQSEIGEADRLQSPKNWVRMEIKLKSP